MKSDFVKKLIKEDILNDFEVIFPLKNYDIKNSSSFYLVKNWNKLSTKLYEKYGDKFLLIDLYHKSPFSANSPFFYNGEDVFIFGSIPVILNKKNKIINVSENSAHLFFYKGDYWNVLQGDFSIYNNKFKVSFIETFNFLVSKFRIIGTYHFSGLEMIWADAFKDLQYQWYQNDKRSFSYSFDDQNLIWVNDLSNTSKIPLIDFYVFQHYRLSYARDFLKLEDKYFFHYYYSTGLTPQQALLMSLMSKIDSKVIKQAISKKQYVKQKEDFKKYLEFNCNLNFNKLTYGQILLIYTLNQKFNLFDFNQKAWKRIVNIIKDIQSFFENDNKFIEKLLDLLSQTPITTPTNEPERLWLDDWRLQMFLFIFTSYLKSKKITDNMIKDIIDIFSMRFDISNNFNYDFSFEFIHNIITSNDRKKYIKKIHDKTVEELNSKKAKEAAKNSSPLKVVKSLLTNTADFEFVPIKNTYDLFLLGEEFHNCVYSRRIHHESVFYKVIHKDKKYCLECNQTDGDWTIYEIKAPFNEDVKDVITNKIESLLKKHKREW